MSHLNCAWFSVRHRSNKNFGITVRIVEMCWDGKLLLPAITVSNLNANTATIQIVSRFNILVWFLKRA